MIFDEHVHYLHMVFNKGKGFRSFSNSNVYMTVIHGVTSPDGPELHAYGAGTLLKIPFKVKMNVKNLNEDTLWS